MSETLQCAVSADMSRFVANLTKATRAFDEMSAAAVRTGCAWEDFARELRWTLYCAATGRSALSEAIKPW